MKFCSFAKESVYKLFINLDIPFFSRNLKIDEKNWKIKYVSVPYNCLKWYNDAATESPRGSANTGIITSDLLSLIIAVLSWECHSNGDGVFIELFLY